jgi:hypothetical protein
MIPKVPNMTIGMLDCRIAKFWSESTHFLPIQNSRLDNYSKAKLSQSKHLRIEQEFLDCGKKNSNFIVAMLSITHLRVMNDFG